MKIRKSCPEEAPEAAHPLPLVPKNAEDGATPAGMPALPLHRYFDANSEVQQWDPANFEIIRKLQDASRNKGQVILMKDQKLKQLVAVKQMPTKWVRKSHADFVINHPSETELPWQDVGTIRFLNSQNYEYACDLLGVYRDEQSTYVVTSLATEGDLFSWCETPFEPGRNRELEVLPIIRQLIRSVQQLHDFGIAHRDLSLENCLLTKIEGDPAHYLRIIDFSMASTGRMFQFCVRGKASYQAPELHKDGYFDGFLADAFSVGVTIYAMMLKDYPWLSTRPSGCKCYDYVLKHGFRAYFQKRKLRGTDSRVVDFMSENLQSLLEGLLCLDPAKRLTLGEETFGQRRSVWDEPWLSSGPG